MNIYLYKNDEQFGPYTIGQVQALVVDGSYTPLDSAWFEGCDDWTTISHVPGILVPEQVRQEPVMPPVEAYSGDQPYVFISYAHKDSAVVYEEIQRLHDANYRIWYDEGIEVSNEWPEEIAQAVIRCAVFLVYISPRSAASVNCRNEINMALNKNKAFLAVYLEETDLPPGLELRMGDLQAILKFRMPDSTYCKKVFAGLGKLLGEGGRDIPHGEDPV
ncbi:MAG: TIR domain-containing protein, partial [Opitutales bacterium]